jgi:hypothetical protein
MIPDQKSGRLSEEQIKAIRDGLEGIAHESWQYVMCDDGRPMVATKGDVVCLADPNHSADELPDLWDVRNFQHIARLDPPTVASLLSERDRLREAISALIAEHDNAYDGEPMTGEKALALDAARAALAKAVNLSTRNIGKNVSENGQLVSGERERDGNAILAQGPEKTVQDAAKAALTFYDNLDRHHEEGEALILDRLQAALAAAPTAALPDDVTRLVIAARDVAYSEPTKETLRELDKAAEAFAERVPWDDEPDDAIPSTPAPQDGMQSVRVKPLEWRKRGSSIDAWEASCIATGLHFVIDRGDARCFGEYPLRIGEYRPKKDGFKALEEAQAFAANYRESRIRSALGGDHG